MCKKCEENAGEPGDMGAQQTLFVPRATPQGEMDNEAPLVPVTVTIEGFYHPFEAYAALTLLQDALVKAGQMQNVLAAMTESAEVREVMDDEKAAQLASQLGAESIADSAEEFLKSL